MPGSLRSRSPRFPQGIGGATLALPVLDAMGAEVTDRFRDVSAPSTRPTACRCREAEHGISEWSWFPAKGATASSSSASPPNRWRRSARSSASWAALYHPNGPKADPHTCSDMWLTGAPLQNPKPGTYNTAGLDQVIALHTKQYCRQPSLVLSIDAGTGYLSRTGTISYNLDGRPIPAENNPRRIFDRLFRADRSSLQVGARKAAAPHQAGGRRGRERARAGPATRHIRSRTDGSVPDLAGTRWRRA